MLRKYTQDEAYTQMTEILSGSRNTSEIVQFLSEKSVDTTSPSQLLSFLNAIKITAAKTINADDYKLPLVDISGTGGDMLNTVNISTLASVVASASDTVMACKYGNRSASGVCGSMDVLEAVGILIEDTDRFIQSSFIPLYARSIYPGAKNVAPARLEFGKFSVFNLLFPLARPISGHHSVVMGFAHPEMMKISAQILKNDSVRALLVHGMDGLDEISVTNSGDTMYSLIDNGRIYEGIINIPSVLCIHPIRLELLQISSKDEAIKLFIDSLDPKKTGEQLEAIRVSVAVNAAAVLTLPHLDSPHKFEQVFVSNYYHAMELISYGIANKRFHELQGKRIK